MSAKTSIQTFLKTLGINTETTHWNLDSQALIEAALLRKEGMLTDAGALACTTGEHTGRSPKDKFIVKDASTEALVDWGAVNQSMAPEQFHVLQKDQAAYLQNKELFIRDALGGAAKRHQISVRVINESAWTNLFCKNLFIRPSENAAPVEKPDFTIVHTPGFYASPEKHGTKSGTFVVVNFKKGLILIGGTQYAGEMKKSIFTVLNFLYPQKGIFPMHCSANTTHKTHDNTALFFGLSGTGKTTLSADDARDLIGDDEHGWSDEGVFNFEGGCYAKCIRLSKKNEPQIWNAIRDGAILENVVVDPQTKIPNYDDGSLTENTRAAYPLEYIDNAILSGVGGHPTNIIFLTCDAFGVMPPISKLSPEQAMYHFLSGYTAKVAGTEKGLSNEPSATFSACFGAPFLPMAPSVYAEMLGKKMREHKVDCWLVNTGWIGGGFGVGERINLPYTRCIVNAALGGALKSATFTREPYFGLQIPESVPGVPKEILSPKSTWKDPTAYDAQAKKLCGLFVENFKKFKTSEEILKAGPKV